MEVLSLVETGYANEDDVADMYEKPRRWVSDKLREGKKALEIMIQKIVILEIGEIANGF